MRIGVQGAYAVQSDLQRSLQFPDRVRPLKELLDWHHAPALAFFSEHNGGHQSGRNVRQEKGDICPPRLMRWIVRRIDYLIRRQAYAELLLGFAKGAVKRGLFWLAFAARKIPEVRIRYVIEIVSEIADQLVVAYQGNLGADMMGRSANIQRLGLSAYPFGRIFSKSYRDEGKAK